MKAVRYGGLRNISVTDHLKIHEGSDSVRREKSGLGTYKFFQVKACTPRANLGYTSEKQK